ncbi:MAG: glycosyltransferase family A protein [Gammaproteobacteria bacterium]|nr:glycosyltransferase family A protein [Gammaproteobacteria bacterium]
MRISVVIPAYNRAYCLPRALDSVRAQTSPVDEIIVVDDGSDDGSAEILARDYPAVRVLRQANRGVSAARNRGISAAQHDWIALLDSDDSWLPHKIERIRAAWRRNPGMVLFHSDEIWMRNGVRVNPMKKHRKAGGWIFEHCLPLCAISPSASVLRRNTLDALGGFDETLPACEDYDLWLRLCARHEVGYIDAALIVKHGGHPDQLSRRYPAMDRFRVRALDRLLRARDLPPAAAGAARAMLRHKLEILLGGAHKHDNRDLIAEFTPLYRHWCRSEAVQPRC